MVMKAKEEMILEAYAAFNRRDIPAVLDLLDKDVEWPNGMEGGTEHGHAAVQDYWTRQWKILDPNVRPLKIKKISENEYDVTVKQVVKNSEGEILVDQIIHHLHEFKNNLIVKMTIEQVGS
jgi:hypothetical protein